MVCFMRPDSVGGTFLPRWRPHAGQRARDQDPVRHGAGAGPQRWGPGRGRPAAGKPHPGADGVCAADGLPAYGSPVHL